MKERTWSLPEPEKRKRMAPARFTTEARLLHRLGTESVSDQILSIIELLKNSYDAQASEVYLTLKNLKTGESKIILEDNGNGMTTKELTDGWLRIATSIKHKQKNEAKGTRSVLGEKGIGRLAVENLSHNTIVTSYPKKSKVGYEIIFDWDKYSTSTDLEKIENKKNSFGKQENIHGLKIELTDLRYRWREEDVQRLQRSIRSMSPPNEEIANFDVIVVSDEFEDLSGKIDNNFLEKAVFKFQAILQSTGEVTYKFWKHGKQKPDKEKIYKYPRDLTCGPVQFDLYFYYLEKNKLKSFGVNVDNIKEIKDTLDNYGGIKIYRDKIRLSSFGNPEDDWLGLNNWSRNEPSVIPSTHQILSTVRISSKHNPEINDTAARENIIKNHSFQDLTDFINDCIEVYGQMRAEVETKRQAAPKPPNKYVEHAKKKSAESRTRRALLDFANDYPYKTFYRRLEDEINLCNERSLPNATLILARKLVENLLYNILEIKFPAKRDLWYKDTKHGGRTQDFSILIDNLDKNTSFFQQDERVIIHKLLTHIEPFRREANSKAHKVIEYLETMDEIDKLKIDEIVDLEIQLATKLKAKNP